MVRVFVPRPAEPGDDQQALAAWQDANRTGTQEARCELSLRLPAARLLEFTFEGPGAQTPRITLPDDGSPAAEQMSGARSSLPRCPRCGPATCYASR